MIFGSMSMVSKRIFVDMVYQAQPLLVYDKDGIYAQSGLDKGYLAQPFFYWVIQ